MTIARSRQVSFQDTPYYHMVSHCVRWAPARVMNNRRQWVVDKLGQLLERWVSKKEE